MRLFGGKIGFVGSGIHSLSSQILSKSFRNWFENRTLRGTELERSSLLSFFCCLPLITHILLTPVGELILCDTFMSTRRQKIA